jgi:copper chaperone CopZ
VAITTLRIADMPAVHAIQGVYTALTAVEGITALEVRLGTATIEHDGQATEESLRRALEAAGYRVTASRSEARKLPVAREDAEF